VMHISQEGNKTKPERIKNQNEPRPNAREDLGLKKMPYSENLWNQQWTTFAEGNHFSGKGVH